jgi:hypothetical protein
MALRGNISDLKFVPEDHHADYMYFAEWIKRAFIRNGELLKVVNLSCNKQCKELKRDFGMGIHPMTISKMKRGQLYKCGLLLLLTLKLYWKRKGYEFRLEDPLD